MGLVLDYTDGQTPLEENEKEGLLIKTISTRSELDEFEQQNIEKAVLWTMKRKFKAVDILSESFIKELHRKMYADVWKWAGEFRKTNKNLGVDKLEISVELRKLIDDCIFWIDKKSFDDDEIAVRFKHRLVSIHCFANGNGRHSRLIADIISEQIFKKPVFSWGAANLVKQGDARKTYLNTVKAADKGNYDLLIAFSRS
ncbi:MAG: mobile mystery protein B [Flavitalea sp.]